MDSPPGRGEIDRPTRPGLADFSWPGAVARGDRLHRLVRDLHKALNRLAARCAEDVVDGAHAYGLQPDDRPAVTAFMRDVNRTGALKFDHPGLDTTATRAGARLTIQNDVGA